jgi:hypothetical protein
LKLFWEKEEEEKDNELLSFGGQQRGYQRRPLIENGVEDGDCGSRATRPTGMASGSAPTHSSAPYTIPTMKAAAD